MQVLQIVQEPPEYLRSSMWSKTPGTKLPWLCANKGRPRVAMLAPAGLSAVKESGLAWKAVRARWKEGEA